MNKFLCGIICGLFLLPLKSEAKLFKAAQTALENGLQVVVIENRKAPIVKQMLWYKIGAVNEKRGKGGTAHLLEHLMFRGTNKVKDGEFNRILHENGVDSNAFTGYDVTAYHQFADISRLELLLALEADRMKNLQISEKNFATEQKIVFEERKQVVENNPSAPFGERLNMLLWGSSPYGHPIGGLSDEIMELTIADVQEFYQKYYAPNNAILVLSGDIDLETGRKLAEKYFGDIEAQDFQKSSPKAAMEKFSETLEMKLPNITTPKMVYKYLLPKYDAVKGSFYDYLVLAEYLGGGKTSALYRDLVVKQKVAVSVSTGYNFVSGGNGVFVVSAVPAQSFTTEELAILLQSALNEAMKNLTLEKLQKVKRKMLANLVFVNDNPEDAANWIGYMLANGFSLDEVQNYEQNISMVQLSAVRNAFQEVFNNSAVVKGTLLPQKEQTDDQAS